MLRKLLLFAGGAAKSFIVKAALSTEKLTFPSSINLALCQLKVGIDKKNNIENVENALSSVTTADLIVSSCI
jgi:hypothetical protein